MRCGYRITAALFIFSLTGCLLFSGAPREEKQGKEQRLFTEAQKALDARDYADAIGMFQQFTATFPRSERYTWALQRLGECFEGLLEVAYRQKVAGGAQEKTARETFLASYGHFNCWEAAADGLQYNRTHYKTILEKHSESPIADEAAYRLIVWQKDYQGRPEGPLAELQALEAVLEKYPDSSLRYEILYKMAYRCHVLYEIYEFSPRPQTRDHAKADQYRAKALYLYRLALNAPSQNMFSQKAWEGLKVLEEGTKRIYVSE